MPLAAALLVLARLGGGTGAGHGQPLLDRVPRRSTSGSSRSRSPRSRSPPALSALYLWQERRLKHRRPAALLGRAPSLLTLETLTGRTIAVALPALTVGIVAGLVRLRRRQRAASTR